MKLKLFFEGRSVVVTSERAAKTWARNQLGVKRVYETPTERGWQYWPSAELNEDYSAVTVVVL
jgi:hypothetical protein